MLVSELRETTPYDQFDQFVDDFDDDAREGYPSLFIGPSLRACRERAGKRQVDVAKFLGVDTSVPSRWEGQCATRYKSTPGKYLEPLADFFGCSVSDLAPQLADVLPAAGKLDQHGSWAATVASGLAATSMRSRLGDFSAQGAHACMPGERPISSYTIGGGPFLEPRSAPGTPPSELRAIGAWRRECRACHYVHFESVDQRAPDNCDRCGAALRARVRVTLTHVS